MPVGETKCARCLKLRKQCGPLLPPSGKKKPQIDEAFWKRVKKEILKALRHGKTKREILENISHEKTDETPPEESEDVANNTTLEGHFNHEVDSSSTMDIAGVNWGIPYSFQIPENPDIADHSGVINFDMFSDELLPSFSPCSW
jgi:hypothetical protein